MQVIKSGSIITNIEQTSRSFDTGLDVDIAILDETTKVITDVSLSTAYTNGLMSFSYDFNALEGRFYFVTITQSNTELVKFKIFCTDQTDLQDYQITEGDFIQAPSSSDEIITV